MSHSARAATVTDDDVVAAMIVQLFVEDPSPHTVTREGALRTLARFRAEPVRGTAVVLEEAGACAGYALLASFWSDELGGEICVIDELFVVKEHRGRGLAAWFVQSLREKNTPWFRDAVAVELEVTPANTKARALYERLGFRPKKNATLRALPPTDLDPGAR